MSDLQRLKSTLEAVAQSSRQTGGSLAQFKSNLAKQKDQVAAAIGGSAQRKDREVLEALTRAGEKIDAAVYALDAAARAAGEYGRSL
ncbi:MULTISPECIES: hypothetical protein [Mycolicibacterium]|uniref:Uncharacterized protein n=1 Tax=Mycolicibacterium vanbaalenii (strain DSM 7251 / JCM 13017 / BCRC 16820 / KCTC 9966 / NRRL B-24157 / PYR-1) TaxID=350058 RepID=A1THQ8_MYCVP|nr:hypothetical protein [Mycolicibacterium vanbaalenii]ABM16708.1 hypothetical protein Mvan_5949 [Mycolicibacterium vanbaalenii PYR-1]MCV7130320.1 hypothetical protein [Mycolicibacterium vanbaalenii PYR-1]